MFEAIQKRLAWLARFMILIAGGSGFYMLDFIDGWSRYSEPEYWWIHLMTFVWALFMFVFFGRGTGVPAPAIRKVCEN